MSRAGASAAIVKLQDSFGRWISVISCGWACHDTGESFAEFGREVREQNVEFIDAMLVLNVGSAARKQGTKRQG